MYSHLHLFYRLADSVSADSDGQRQSTRKRRQSCAFYDTGGRNSLAEQQVPSSESKAMSFSAGCGRHAHDRGQGRGCAAMEFSTRLTPRVSRVARIQAPGQLLYLAAIPAVRPVKMPAPRLAAGRGPLNASA